MGDYLLDIRPPAQRFSSKAAIKLKLTTYQQVVVLEREAFALALTFCGDATLWAPYSSPDGSCYAVMGITALEESEWNAADEIPGPGGLAAKAICRRYQQGGVAALEHMNGNYVVLAHDAPRSELYLVTDCAGVFPTFECQANGGWILGSHPDVLARAAGLETRLDEVSLAEFVLTSTVTPPFTFYHHLRAVEHGAVLTFRFHSVEPLRRKYFTFKYRGEEDVSVDALAEDLAQALRHAVRRRALPRLGTPAMALSGGLDSRLLLACLPDPSRALAFCCYDEPNRELATAERVARSLAVRFLPLQRGSDYYGENAETGVRVSGGMGTIANNHFLGFLNRLHAEGMQNLLTGCYCDYLFKGLPLNRHRHWLTGREHLAPFSYEFYFDHWKSVTLLAAQARERWENHFPADLRRQVTPASIFDLEVRRTFPLCYEGDNQQRLVPQRLTVWSPPIIDRQVLEVYCRIPPRMKLNRLLVLKTARYLLADSPLLHIPDANTGAPLDASPLQECLSTHWLRLERKIASQRRSLASDGSWPDWQYYLTHSPHLAELWRRPQPEAFDFFRKVMGWKTVPTEPRDFQNGRTFLFVSMLTLKIWWEQRARSNA